MNRIYILIFLSLLVLLFLTAGCQYHWNRMQHKTKLYDVRKGYVATVQSIYDGTSTFLKGLCTSSAFPVPGTLLKGFKFTPNPLNENERGITYEMLDYKSYQQGSSTENTDSFSEMLYANDLSELDQLCIDYMQGRVISELDIRSFDNSIFLRYKYLYLESATFSEYYTTPELLGQTKSLEFLNDLEISCKNTNQVLSSLKAYVNTDNIGRNWIYFGFSCSKI